MVGKRREIKTPPCSTATGMLPMLPPPRDKSVRPTYLDDKSIYNPAAT